MHLITSYGLSKPRRRADHFDVGANNGSVTEKYARLYPGASDTFI